MSYRNPQQVVDTQSGQHIRNMMQQITGATVGALDKIKKEADIKKAKNLADRKAQADRLFKAETDLNQTALANPGLNVSKTIEENLAKFANGLKKYGNEPYGWPDDFRTFAANVTTMGTAIKMQGASNSALAQQISEIKQKPLGDMGGGDLYTDPSVYEKFDIQFRSGRTTGSSEIEFDMSKPGGPVPYTIIKNSAGEKIGRSLNTDFDIADYPVIPNATKNIQEIGASFKKDAVIKNPMSSLYEGMETITLPADAAGNIEYGKKINPKQLTEYMRKNHRTDDYIDSLTPNEAARFFNNIIRDYVSEEDFSFIGGLGFKINFIDPKMSTWSTDKEGRVNDPRREMVKNAYARFVAEKEGLGVETTNFGTIKPKDSNKTTTLTEAGKKFNDKVSLGKEVLNEIKSLTDNKKQKGSKNFSLDKLGAFIDVINSKRKGSDPEIVRTEDLKALYLRQDGKTEESWEDVRPKTDLAYRTSSGAIIPVDISDPKKLNNSMLDLLIPGIKPSERDRLLKAIIGGNQDRPKLP